MEIIICMNTNPTTHSCAIDPTLPLVNFSSGKKSFSLFSTRKEVSDGELYLLHETIDSINYLKCLCFN